MTETELKHCVIAGIARAPKLAKRYRGFDKPLIAFGVFDSISDSRQIVLRDGQSISSIVEEFMTMEKVDETAILADERLKEYLADVITIKLEPRVVHKMSVRWRCTDHFNRSPGAQAIDAVFADSHLRLKPGYTEKEVRAGLEALSGILDEASVGVFAIFCKTYFELV